MFGRIFSLIVFILIVIIGVTFALLNDGQVTLNYYIGTKQLPVSLLIILCLGVGALVGIFVTLFPLFRLKRSNWQLKRRIKQVEQEVQNLRSIPIKD